MVIKLLNYTCHVIYLSMSDIQLGWISACSILFPISVTCFYCHIQYPQFAFKGDINFLNFSALFFPPSCRDHIGYTSLFLSTNLYLVLRMHQRRIYTQQRKLLFNQQILLSSYQIMVSILHSRIIKINHQEQILSFREFVFQREGTGKLNVKKKNNMK